VELVSLLRVAVVLSFVEIGSGVECGDGGDGGCVRVGIQAGRMFAIRFLKI